MTFRGNLLLYSLWYELHPFENLRRKGHHCRGLTHLSWAERKIFYRVLGKKILWAVHLPWTVSAAGCGCMSPRRQGLIRVCGTRQAMSRDPPQRRRARARNGVAPYIPAAFCRDAGSAGHGATRVARPFRSLQTRGFASGMEARQGGDSFAGSVHDSPPRQGDARKRHCQENNKTDRNQGSSNQSQNRRKKRIIKGKVM